MLNDCEHGASGAGRGTSHPPLPAPRSPSSWGLYLVTDRRQTAGRDLAEVVERALAGGVRAVQVREKDLTTKELYRLAEVLLARARARGAALLVNDRVDVALALGADGVHLGRRSLPPAAARQLLGAGRLIGVSCHSVADVREAAQGGADFAVLGPIYATPSKARYGAPLSPAVLQPAREASAIPIIAIGGIGAARVPEVVSAGARGVAVISAVMAAPDPAAAAADLLRAWEAAGGGRPAGPPVPGVDPAPCG